MIDNDTTLVVADISIADLDDEAVLLDIQSGIYYRINEVGATIVHLLEEPRTAAEVIDTLLQAYEVDRDQLGQDVLAFLQALATNHLIHIIDA